MSLLEYFAHLWSSKSAAIRPDHFPSLDSSPAPSGRFTLHILTCPSRLPVAMRWIERPQEGAQEMEVVA